MARLLENQVLELLQRKGVRVPRFQVAGDPEQARSAAAALGGPVVIKALVPTGKRGKAGGVLFAADPEEAASCAKRLLGSQVGCYPVTTVLVEEKLDVRQELYLSLTIDHARQMISVIASVTGGVDVEEQSRGHAANIKALVVDPAQGLPDFAARQLWSDIGAASQWLTRLGSMTAQLYRIFVDLDASILELNPVVITTDDQVLPAAALMAIDDAAMFRHPDLATTAQVGVERTWKPLSDLEKQVVAVQEAEPYRGTARYTEMEGGDIGLLCGGGGASLLLFDAILQAGGHPANYSEVGGNPTAQKVYGITKAILSKRGVKGLLVAHNITNNTQVDAIAEGVIRALGELGLDPRSFPVVAREAGVNEEQAARLLREAGAEYHSDDITLTEAAHLIVTRVQEASQRYPRAEAMG